MDSARAGFYRIEIQGMITDPLPGSPLATTLYINDKARGCDPKCVTQYSDTILGYAKEAISGFAPISIQGQTFEQSDLVAVSARSGQPSSVNTWDRIILVNRGRGALAKSEVRMDFRNRNGFSLRFDGRGLSITGSTGTLSRITTTASGIVTVRVTAFAGEPGLPNCHGRSVAALASTYGGLAEAADALKYPSVDALQVDITMFCGA